MSEIVLRPAKLEELDVLLEFEQGIIEAERPFDPTLKPDHINYYDLKELIQSDRAEVVVAAVNDEVVGSGYVKIQQSKPFQTFDHHGYIGFMYVKPEHRGKGISQLILDEMANWAKSKNLVELRLEVYDGNSSAVKAYEKAGYKKNLVEMRLGLED